MHIGLPIIADYIPKSTFKDHDVVNGLGKPDTNISNNGLYLNASGDLINFFGVFRSSLYTLEHIYLLFKKYGSSVPGNVGVLFLCSDFFTHTSTLLLNTTVLLTDPMTTGVVWSEDLLPLISTPPAGNEFVLSIGYSSIAPTSNVYCRNLLLQYKLT